MAKPIKHKPNIFSKELHPNFNRVHTPSSANWSDIRFFKTKGTRAHKLKKKLKFKEGTDYNKIPIHQFLTYRENAPIHISSLDDDTPIQ